MKTTLTQQTIVALERRYNADNDLIPGAPLVTWTDSKIVEITDQLLAYILQLEQRIITLEKKQSA
jgi:hypothetical protein